MSTAQLILLGVRIASAAAEGVPQAIAAAAAVERMVAEERDPTPAEWAELNAITDALHARLQTAAGEPA
ncbi:hypothetical protein [Thalassobaculum sp.]|uniref:hypothetical protein n=1 Tax=Thalassobaculum sp. TaxID=2022740 RepID=UPI0032EE6502